MFSNKYTRLWYILSWKIFNINFIAAGFFFLHFFEFNRYVGTYLFISIDFLYHFYFHFITNLFFTLFDIIFGMPTFDIGSQNSPSMDSIWKIRSNVVAGRIVQNSNNLIPSKVTFFRVLTRQNFELRILIFLVRNGRIVVENFLIFSYNVFRCWMKYTFFFYITHRGLGFFWQFARNTYLSYLLLCIFTIYGIKFKCAFTVCTISSIFHYQQVVTFLYWIRG